MTNLLAVVLAGGLGTRLRYLLPELPKPLAPVAGRPFLEWVVRFLCSQGLQRIVLSTGHYADKVDAFAAGLQIPGLTLSCVREQEPLGTGGGFLHSLRGSGDTASDVLVCNGDSLVLAELAPMIAAVGDPRVDGALLSVRAANASRFGTIEIADDGKLLGFSEKRLSAGLVNGGVYLFRRATIARFPEKKPLSFEYDVFPSLLADGAWIVVVPCDAPSLDIGTEDSLSQAGAFIRDNMRWFR